MKKNTDYYIDFATNTVTVTRKFMEGASVLGSAQFKTMMELRALGMTIVTRKISRPNVRKNKSLSYNKMQQKIMSLLDAEAYMDEFNAVREASKGEMNPYRYVLNWYEKTFPTHADVPEFDSNNRIVNYPKNYSQMDA